MCHDTYPHGGDLFVFRGKSGKLLKIFWHDGIGASLYAKRLERGRFVWPTTTGEAVVITPGQLGYLLEGIDWGRRITDGRQRVGVPHDEGVANHIGPESCAGGREAAREALTGVRVGQPLSGVRLPFRSLARLRQVPRVAVGPDLEVHETDSCSCQRRLAEEAVEPLGRRASR